MRTILITALYLSVMAIFLPSAALAGGPPHRDSYRPYQDHCESRCNPDGRISVTITAGTGNVDAAFHRADVNTLGFGFIAPVTNDITLLARYDHGETEWKSAGHAALFDDSDTDLFTVGLRLYLGH